MNGVWKGRRQITLWWSHGRGFTGNASPNTAKQGRRALLYGWAGPALASCHSNLYKQASLVAPCLFKMTFHQQSHYHTHMFVAHIQVPSCRPECSKSSNITLSSNIVFPFFPFNQADVTCLLLLQLTGWPKAVGCTPGLERIEPERKQPVKRTVYWRWKM